MYGGTTGQIAVGRYVLQIGEPYGASIREAPRAERAHLRPRATPILQRPRLIRGLLDRQGELTSALSALDAGLPIEVSGEPGIGKTALLRHLAHQPRAAAFVDGILYVPAQHQPASDIVQIIFEAFNESEASCLPTDAEIRRGLQEKQAFIILDDVHLPQNELERVIDIAPRSVVAVATRERCLWGEVRGLALKGLPGDAAVALLEREIERPLDVAERSEAANLCAALEGHPLRILQAAAIVRERGIPIGGWTRDITSEGIITELMAAIDDKQRRALLALGALPGVPLEAGHIAGIAEVTDIEPSLMLLVRRGLVVCNQSLHRLADGVGDRLRRTEDLKPWLNRAITYFTSWAERHQRDADILLDHADILMRVQQYAAEHRRSGEVLELGRVLEKVLALRARWGAWAIVLDRCLAAAKAIGDRSDEAWALHEIGTRAVCLGDVGLARVSLNQALRQRESLDDSAGAAVSRQNLSFVLPPPVEPPNERPPAPPDPPEERAAPAPSPLPAPTSLPPPAPAPPLGEGVDLASISLDDVPPLPMPIYVARTRNHAGTPIVTMLLLVIVAGGLGYWAYFAGFSWKSLDVARLESFVRSGFERARASLATRPPPQQKVPEAPTPAIQADAPDAVPSPRILIFTPRPGSIATRGATNLCYATSDAVEARVDPGVGKVSPTSTLTCLPVTPTRTTTYQLTAYGREGQQVSEQLVIVVR